MTILCNFYLSSVQNRNTTLAEKAETLGNACLYPLRKEFSGKKFLRIPNENLFSPTADIFLEKSHHTHPEDHFLKRVLRVAELLPGLILGTGLKAVSFLSSDVRKRNIEAIQGKMRPIEVTGLSSGFDQMTCRVKNRALLIEKISSLDSQKLETFKQVVEDGAWEDAFFDDPEYPFYALKLFQEGAITDHQFATIQMFWVATKARDKKPECIPLFLNDGSINNEAYQIVKQTLTLRSNNQGSYNADKSTYKSFDLGSFFEQMKKAPKSEKILFVIDDCDGFWKNPEAIFGRQSYFDSHTITQEIHSATGINYLCRFTICRFNNESKQIVPGLGIMQQFLQTGFGKNAVRLQPVLGLSTVGQIRQNGLEATRDFYVPFPGIDMPDRADGFKAPWHEFCYHDFYHALTASSMPNAHRKEMIVIADSVVALKRKSVFYQSSIRIFSEKFIDMENPAYSYSSNIAKYSKASTFAFSVMNKPMHHMMVEAGKNKLLLLTPELFWFPKKAVCDLLARKMKESKVITSRHVTQGCDSFIFDVQKKISSLEFQELFYGSSFQIELKKSILHAQLKNNDFVTIRDCYNAL